MDLKLYNTLSRKKEIFKPINSKKVRMYVCGPTVYDDAHIGHAKTATQFDIIARFLRLSEYRLNYIQNITDIDDKIIKKSSQEKLGGGGWKKIRDRYEKSYIEDMKRLNVVSVDKYARATDYLPQIISQVKRLIGKGYAYKIFDGWYFDLSKLKDYGKLARRTTLEAEDAVSRIDDNKEKKNKGDFCLWKFPKKDEPKWKSEFGDGRPGWHIEDTAITEKEFGPQYDIHGGGMDLIFPHHEAEIAQMESISGKKPLVRYWLHTGFLEVNKSKMGKSKGNFYKLKDILDKGYNALHLRYLFLLCHYRKPLNFTWDSLEAAKNAYEKLKNISLNLSKSKSKSNKKNIELAKKHFIDYLKDDFNVPKALSYMWDILRDEKLNDSEKYELVLFFDKVFGLNLDKIIKVEIPKEIIDLINKRKELRKRKKFEESDKIRDKVNKLGFFIEDTDNGLIVRKK